MSMIQGISMMLFFLAYIGITIGVVILLIRFVRAHERMADALENVARKFRDDGK